MAKVEKIIKKHTVKDEAGNSITKEVEYRIDADFVPEKASEICNEFIENYCVANKKIDWLVAKVQETITDKNGKEKDLPFVNLRADFVKEFFPSIIIGTKKKGDTFKERILAKYKK